MENGKQFAKARLGINANNWTEIGQHFDKVKEKRDGKDIATHQMQDPNQEKFAQWDNESVTAGSSMFSAHKSKVKNPSHPDHEKALKLQMGKFNNDDNVALAYFVDYARKTMGAEKRHIPNMAYQNNLFKNMSFITPDDQAFGHKLKMMLEKKWDAMGYQHDSEFVDAFVKDHPFSNGDPRTLNFSTADDFQPYDPWIRANRPGADGIRRGE